MIPTSTRATLTLSTSIPSNSMATAIFVHKEAKAGDKYPGLAAAEQKALEELISQKALRGKSNEVTVQLIAGPKPARLLVIGLGEESKFSAACLREAGAALAKAAAKQRFTSGAGLPPRNPHDPSPMPRPAPPGGRPLP